MPPTTRSKSTANIYTVLAVIATLALIVGVAYVWNVNTTLTGQGNPMYIIPGK